MATTKTTKMKLTFGKDATGKPTLTIRCPGGTSFISRQNAFRTHLLVMQQFQVEMKLLQTGGYMLPGAAVSIWFPKIQAGKNGQWENRLCANDTEIDERTPSNRPTGASPWDIPLRIAFAKFGNGYSFVGVFEKDSKASSPTVSVFKRRDDVTDIEFGTAVTTV